jgi:hypothetical protein
VSELWLPLYTSCIFRALFSLIKLIITYQKKKKKKKNPKIHFERVELM